MSGFTSWTIITGISGISGAYTFPRPKAFVLAGSRFSYETYLALGASKEYDYVYVNGAEELKDVHGKVIILDDFCLHSDIVNILKAIQDRMYI